MKFRMMTVIFFLTVLSAQGAQPNRDEINEIAQQIAANNEEIQRALVKWGDLRNELAWESAVLEEEIQLQLNDLDRRLDRSDRRIKAVKEDVENYAKQEMRIIAVAGLFFVGFMTAQYIFKKA